MCKFLALSIELYVIVTDFFIKRLVIQIGGNSIHRKYYGYFHNTK